MASPWCNGLMTIAAAPEGIDETGPGSGRGRVHGTSSAAPFDRWFRYPAGFATDYVSYLLDQTKLQGGTVIDPFTGSGVTGTSALAKGFAFAGVEAHPLVAELAQLKLSSDVDADALLSSAHAIVQELAGVGGDLTETSLVTRSFDAEVLWALVQIRDAIKSLPESSTNLALKWALLATLRDVAGVKVGWPYQRPGVSRMPRHLNAGKRFVERCQMIAEDVTARGSTGAQALVVVGDSANAATWDAMPVGAGCITSPPYLNNFDYADATRLELYFWGEIKTWREMCELVRTDMVIATTQQSSKPAKEAALASLEYELGAGSAPIAELTKKIQRTRAERGGRTKEYDQVVPSYFLTMTQILRNLAASLEPGAEARWLVGDSAPYDTYIDTPRLIGEIAAAVGFDFTSDTLLRHRGKRWTRSRSHDLSERMIVLRRI